MKQLLRFVSLLVLVPAAFGAAEKNCGCACCRGREVCCCQPAKPVDDPAAAKRHSLRGVILAVHAAESELTVRHEAIPGVMPAMTMLFRVDRPLVARAKKGQTITAQLARQGDSWWLHDVQSPAG